MASEKHLKYRRMPFNPNVPESLFSEAELKILNKYGSWMAALMKGVIEPESLSQYRFIEVCNGNESPETEYEKVWVHFIKRKLWEYENPDYVGKESTVLAEMGIAGSGWGVYGHFR